MATLNLLSQGAKTIARAGSAALHPTHPGAQPLLFAQRAIQTGARPESALHRVVLKPALPCGITQKAATSNLRHDSIKIATALRTCATNPDAAHAANKLTGAAIVGMGSTRAFELKGKDYAKTSGPLVYCSAAVLEGRRNGKPVACLMTHHGHEDIATWAKEFRAVINLEKYAGIEWAFKALQHGCDTLITPESRSGFTAETTPGGVIGMHENTAESLKDALENELPHLAGQIKITKARRYDLLSNVCEARYENGELLVPESGNFFSSMMDLFVSSSTYQFLPDDAAVRSSPAAEASSGSETSGSSAGAE